MRRVYFREKDDKGPLTCSPRRGIPEAETVAQTEKSPDKKKT